MFASTFIYGRTHVCKRTDIHTQPICPDCQTFFIYLHSKSIIRQYFLFCFVIICFFLHSENRTQYSLCDGSNPVSRILYVKFKRQSIWNATDLSSLKFLSESSIHLVLYQLTEQAGKKIRQLNCKWSLTLPKIEQNS